MSCWWCTGEGMQGGDGRVKRIVGTRWAVVWVEVVARGGKGLGRVHVAGGRGGGGGMSMDGWTFLG